MPRTLPTSFIAGLSATLLLGVLLSTAQAASTHAAPLSTVAERSGYRQTGRYEEVQALCRDFARAYPKAVRCERFGSTPEGRPMLALVVTQSGALSPAAARRRGLPVLLVQGGIHAGEIDGKDAGFLALRELLEGRAAPGALRRQVLVFVPVFNIDGHERFGAWQRPNQRGPEAMGWRTTAQNYNLNRDYVKADAPEMRAMLGLVERWDPLLTMDLHVTDGAQFEHDISIQVEPLHAGDEGLREPGRQLRDGVIARLAAQGSLPQPFYMSFAHEDDPASGFVDSVPPPRFSHGYFALRNRFGMLVETHSWKDYPTRVRITRNSIVAAVELLAQQGRAWQREALAADSRARTLAATGTHQEPLSWEASPEQRMIDFRGYAYSRTPSEISGALMTRYDESKPEIWHVPLRDQLRPALSATPPRGGYLVPAAEAGRIVPLLRLHGLEFKRLPLALNGHACERFAASAAQFGKASYEARQRLELKGQWQAQRCDIAAGSLYLTMAQPKARLLMAMLEPQAPDSLLAWGQFNNAFERKEYMEAYVAEQVAREQLAADPALAAAFQQRLSDDPAFAANPKERLDFFYRRHPAWDVRYQRYPVIRVDGEPGSAGDARGR